MGEPLLDERYKLEKRLGSGGMGIVYQARHVFLNTKHAIKIIMPDLIGNNPVFLSRFRQEALAAAAIHHPNIVAVTDFGVADNKVPFLVMEFIPGRSLHEILAAEGALRPAKAFRIIAAIGAGVGAAHRQGVIHRDLKPLNIMIQENVPVSEGLKVLDFGLAKIKSDEMLGSFMQVQTSGPMGSPYYMAPEQWSEGDVDARADIYSMGIMLYRMLCGDVPFKGRDMPVIMRKHLETPPPTFESLGIILPSSIETVVRRALEKDPLNRPQSVEAFLEELRHAFSKISPSLVTAPIAATSLQNKRFNSLASFSLNTSSLHNTAVMRINTTPPKSKVFLNNVCVGTTDENGSLSEPDILEGVHYIRVVHEGFLDWETEIESTGGEFRVEAVLKPIPDSGLDEQLEPTGQPAQNIHLDETRRIDTFIQSAASTTLIEPGGNNTGIEANNIPDSRDNHSAASDYSGFRSAQRSTVVSDMDDELPPLDSVLEHETRLDLGNTAPPSQSPGPGNSKIQVTLEPDTEITRVSDPLSKPDRQREVAVRRISRGGLVLACALLILAAAAVTAFFLFRPRHPQSDEISRTPKAKQGSVNPGVSAHAPQLVEIPGGTFQMGRAAGPVDEGPAHTVTVPSFSMDRTEVTTGEYSDFLRHTKRQPPQNWPGENLSTEQELLPVSGVSLDDAKAFAAWRSQKDGANYRLPTEEEWEYAARGGDQDLLYPWGNQWNDNRAETKETGDGAPRPAGSFPEGANRWGCVDLIGNIWEWTSSTISMYPGNDKAAVPPSQKDWVVIRGGSFTSEGKGVKGVTATSRKWVEPSRRDVLLGFRLVRVGS